MTFDELIAEGEALTWPSWILRPEPTESGVVGSWGGERGDVPNALPPKVTAFRCSRPARLGRDAEFARPRASQGFAPEDG